jgi:hypothetical protein
MIEMMPFFGFCLLASMNGWMDIGRTAKERRAIWNMDMVYVYIGEMDFDVLGLCCCAMLLWCVMFWCIVAWFDVRGTPTFLRHGAGRPTAEVG